MGAHPTAVRWCAVGRRAAVRARAAWRPVTAHPRARRSLASAHGVLPKIYRNNPKAFPMLQPADTVQGVLGLVFAQDDSAFVDMSPAFTAAPAPLRHTRALMHNHSEQHTRHATFVSPHGFNLTSVKLDLSQALFARMTS